VSTSYRSRPEDGPRCRFHPLAVASEVCGCCKAEICDVCATFVSSQVACPSCERVLGRRRKLGRAALLVGLVALLGAAGVALSQIPRSDDGPPAAVFDDEAELRSRGCDEGLIIRIVDVMLREHRSELVVDRIHTYLASGCADFPKLRWREREAYTRTGNHGEAVRLMDQLIERNPRDPDYWWWRGDSKRELGKKEEAAADYEQSMALRPTTNLVPERLARVYEDLGRPCEGVVPLTQLLYFASAGARAEAVATWAGDIATSPRCSSWRVSGSATFLWKDEAYEQKVRLGDGIWATFRADTSQAATLVSRTFFAKVGGATPLPPPFATRWVGTPTGLQKASLVRASKLEIANEPGPPAVAPDVVLAVVDTLPEGAHGILGLSVLLRFRVSPRAEEMRIEAPPAP
jgi:hypothetical protein